MITREIATSAADRFWTKVDKFGPVVTEGLGHCWQWTASLDGKGYGHINIRRGSNIWKPMSSHRISWVLAGNDDPSPLYLLHRCDNRRCVRPDHLEPGTQAKNLRDMYDRGRAGKRRYFRGPRDPNCGSIRRGSAHHAAILTEEDVCIIRTERARGVALSVLADRFGIASCTVSAIAVRRLWKHVP